MTTEEIQKAVADGIKQAFADPQVHCRYQIEPDVHSQHHEALVRFMKLMDGIDSIRWSVAKAIVIMLVMGAISLMGWGVFHKIGQMLGGVR